MKGRGRDVVNAFTVFGDRVVVMGSWLRAGGEVIMRLGALCGLVGGRGYVVDALLFVFERLREVIVSLLEGRVGSAGRHRVDL